MYTPTQTRRHHHHHHQQRPFTIFPPLLNSSCPWASTLADLKSLYTCPYTGAVTTRTSLLEGFHHDAGVHQHTFFRSGESIGKTTTSVVGEAVSIDVGDGRGGGGGGGGGGNDKIEGVMLNADVEKSEQLHEERNGDTDGGTSSGKEGVEAPLQVPGLSSLNTYGYSPIPLSEYLDFVGEVVRSSSSAAAAATAASTAVPFQNGSSSDSNGTAIETTTTTTKPFILSVTGTPEEIAMAYAQIASKAEEFNDNNNDNRENDGKKLSLAMEINLSCPNIHGRPPPAYEAEGFKSYLVAVRDSMLTFRGSSGGGGVVQDRVMPRIGIKMPPYTYRGQFDMVVACLKEVLVEGRGEDEDDRARSVVDFLTCTNTLGSSLVLIDDHVGLRSSGKWEEKMKKTSKKMRPVLASESGTGIGGLAGAALHPLALGNVSTFRTLLDLYPETEGVLVIGVGGVEDRDGFERMRSVGAGAVACASALGRYGVGVFEKITKGL